MSENKENENIKTSYIRDRRSKSISPGNSFESLCNNEAEKLEKDFWGVKAVEMVKDLMDTIIDIWMYYNNQIQVRFQEIFSNLNFINENDCLKIFSEFSRKHLSQVKSDIDNFEQYITNLFSTEDKIQIYKQKALEVNNSQTLSEEIKQLIIELESLSKKKAKIQIEIAIEREINKNKPNNENIIKKCIVDLNVINSNSGSSNDYDRSFYEKCRIRQEEVIINRL